MENICLLYDPQWKQFIPFCKKHGGAMEHNWQEGEYHCSVVIVEGEETRKCEVVISDKEMWELKREIAERISQELKSLKAIYTFVTQVPKEGGIIRADENFTEAVEGLRYLRR